MLQQLARPALAALTSPIRRHSLHSKTSVDYNTGSRGFLRSQPLRCSYRHHIRTVPPADFLTPARSLTSPAAPFSTSSTMSSTEAPPSQVLVVYITCPPASSEALSRSIVEARVAACVNRIPRIQSTYSWQGAVEVDEEDLLMAKTTQERYPALERFVLEKHPYDTPEIIAIPVQQGSKAYLDWVQNSVEGGNGGDTGGN